MKTQAGGGAARAVRLGSRLREGALEFPSLLDDRLTVVCGLQECVCGSHF